MKHPKVFIIILNWNGLQDTLECLQSVFKLNYENYEIVVVDNGSQDDSCKEIKLRFQDIVLIENNENLGFAEGNNIGMRYALQHNADYIFLLNNDTIVDSRVVHELLEASQKVNDRGIFGAQIYYYSEPGKVWYAGVQWESSVGLFYHIKDELSKDVVVETAYACGCALFLSTRIIKEIGLLDQKYFLTFEESDWCYRARKKDIRSYCVANAKVYHKISNSFGGSSSPIISYFLIRNSLLWGERHLSLRENINLIITTLKRIGWLSYPENENKQRQLGLMAILLEHYKGKYHSVNSHASYYGLRDYLLRRFGNCPSDVLALSKVNP